MASPAGTARRAPTVVHLQRKGGVEVASCDEYIGRALRRGGWDLPKSRWANPFNVAAYGREGAIAEYEAWIQRQPELMQALSGLEGKRLGCWCAPLPCHGDVLVRLFNARFGSAKGAPGASAPEAVAPRSDSKRAPPSGEWRELREMLGARSGFRCEADWFQALAALLLESAQLVAAGEVFRIVEVEFYLTCAGHEDPAVHRAPVQLATCGAWYFHREKAASLAFTRKGLDLTFGRPGVECGGILIRALQHCASGAIVDGPSKTVDAILTVAGVRCVADLKGLAGFSSDALVSGGLVRLEPAAPALPRAEIRRGPRVGLKAGAPFSRAAYRFRTFADCAKADRRSLTKLGVAEGAAPKPPACAAPTDADFEAIGF